MAVLGFASMTDQLKPDSTVSQPNADSMKFQTGATIVAASLLAPGSAKLHCDASVAKQANAAVLSMLTATGAAATSTDEFCITFIYKVVQAPTAANFAISSGSVPAGTAQLTLKTNLVAGATVFQVFYDNVQVGSNFTLTVGNVYRTGLYVNYATTTVQMYVDDVTSGDIQPGKATQRVSSSAVTMTNHPAVSAISMGQGSGGIGCIHEFQHIALIDSSGSVNNAPSVRVLDPVCVTDASVPIGAGNYFESPFTQTAGSPYTNVDEIPPNDATDTISVALTTAGQANRASFDMSPWATVGNSASDTVLAVRATHREFQNSGVAQETLLRSGSTDTYSGSISASGVWKYVQWVLQQTDPSTSAAWTVAGYDGLEAGCRVTRFGVNETPAITFIRLDAVFIRPVSFAFPRRSMSSLLVR